MNRPLLVLLIGLIATVLAGCSDSWGETEEVSSRYPNGSPQEVSYFRGEGTNQRLVRKILHMPDGTVMGEQNFEDGVEHGESKILYPNGNPAVIAYFDHGVPRGGAAWDSLGRMLRQDVVRPDSVYQNRWNDRFQIKHCEYRVAEEGDRAFNYDLGGDAEYSKHGRCAEWRQDGVPVYDCTFEGGYVSSCVVGEAGYGVGPDIRRR